MNDQRILRRLTIHMGLFAILSASLIALGQGSLRIFSIVTAAVILSWIYTDWLKWLRLNKFVAYMAMVLGAVVAIRDYFNGVDSQQLYSVANLLIYVQLPLYFQTKSRRIFEQLGIFLLLELVVAALVNDNVFYGLLLIPALAIGCSTMILFSYFITNSKSGESLSESEGIVAKLLGWVGSEAHLKAKPSGIRLELNRESELVPQSSWSHFLGELVPTSMALFAFAIAFFYLLPRINKDAYEGSWRQGVVGFSERVTLAQIGQLLQSDQVVMRMSFRDATSGRTYDPLEAPYIRGVALSHYEAGFENGDWTQDSEPLSGSRLLRSDEIDPGFESTFTSVIVSVNEQSPSSGVLMSLPPFFDTNRDFPLEFSVNAWSLRDGETMGGQRNRRKYEFGSLAFSTGRQSPFMPEFEDFYKEESIAANLNRPVLDRQERRELTRFSKSRFRSLLAYRDEVLNSGNLKNESLIDQTLALEEDLALSGKLSYTLNLNMARDRTCDPIEDFIRNHKKGHCQYFASAMTLMLRSMNIPARMVVGYRPAEYNIVGKFFLVRQKHAHTWVEAYFTREQFDKSSVKLPECYKRGAWLRLDPTPPGNGSNAGGTLQQPEQQTLDFAQELWQNYVMEMGQSNQNGIYDIFGESSGGTYAFYMRQLQVMIIRLQQGQMIGGFLAPDQWLSWQTTVLVGIGIVILAVLYRSFHWLMPTWMTNWFLLRFVRKKRAFVKIEFFRRAVRLLEQMGWYRKPSQTYLELTKEADHWLQASTEAGRDGQSSNSALMFLTNLYYRIRYGGNAEITPAEQSQIDRAFLELEEQRKRVSPSHHGHG
jgi:protein-glutamine gamma-glutamyltransferase